MAGATPTTQQDEQTVAKLREESRRCREEARASADPLVKRMLARRALEFAQLAEAAERDPKPGKSTPNPARKRPAVPRKG